MACFRIRTIGPLLLTLAMIRLLGLPVRAGDLPIVTDVAAQPLGAQVRRIADALEFVGRPLSAEVQAEIEAAIRSENEAQAVRKLQDILDPLCLVGVTINPESRVRGGARAPAEPSLMQQGWRAFLVKVHNEAGVTAPLRVGSPETPSRFTSDPPAVPIPSQASRSTRSPSAGSTWPVLTIGR